MLQVGADMRLQDGDGCTALILASSNGHIETVRLLLEANADKDIQDGFGKTALISATGFCSTTL